MFGISIMATDRVTRAGTATLPSPGDDTVVLLWDLVDALTALGNYLEAANLISLSTTEQPTDRLREVLEKSLGQYERAAEAMRRLAHPAM
jgi:hypothetical protein